MMDGQATILMHKKDEEKTTFITDRGTLYYKVTPFSLKNASVTFQCLINQVFAHQIRQNVTTYVNDILVKSKNLNGRLKDLEEIFDTLKQYCTCLIYQSFPSG